MKLWQRYLHLKSFFSCPKFANYVSQNFGISGLIKSRNFRIFGIPKLQSSSVLPSCICGETVRKSGTQGLSCWKSAEWHLRPWAHHSPPFTLWGISDCCHLTAQSVRYQAQVVCTQTSSWCGIGACAIVRTIENLPVAHPSTLGYMSLLFCFILAIK